MVGPPHLERDSGHWAWIESLCDTDLWRRGSTKPSEVKRSPLPEDVLTALKLTPDRGTLVMNWQLYDALGSEFPFLRFPFIPPSLLLPSAKFSMATSSK